PPPRPSPAPVPHCTVPPHASRTVQSNVPRSRRFRGLAPPRPPRRSTDTALRPPSNTARHGSQPGTGHSPARLTARHGSVIARSDDRAAGPMKVIPRTEANAQLAELVSVLQEDGVACFPMGGAYRLAADVRSADAVNRLFQVKRRARSH